MVCLDPARITIEKKGGRVYFLDALTHLAFELNASSELICRGLLSGKRVDAISSRLHERFDGLGKTAALRETRDFIAMLRVNGFLGKNEAAARGRLPPIKKATFCVTERCNLACRHCLASSRPGRGADFPGEKISFLARELENMGCRDVSLFGGEPLLREDFWDIVETFRDRGFTVRVNTNGTRITKCFACRAEKGDIALFTVSLDGARAAVHDRQRGPGAFDKTLSGIGRLVRAGRKVLVSVTVTRLNFENLEAIAKLGRELGVEGVRFNEVHLGGHAACHPAAVRLDGREKRETLERVRALEREFGDFVSGSWIDLSGLMKRAEREKPPGFPLVVRPCGAGMGSVCIRADGRITPCEILWDADCGNVLHRPLREIYERSPAMNRFRRPLVLDARELPACRNCRYLSVCFQGHRCAPYHFPGRGLEARAGLGCWRDA